MEVAIQSSRRATFADLRWVSYGCLLGFALERFAYHVFDLGTLYHRSPMTLVWLLVLPLSGYSVALFRSPLFSTRSRSVRVVALIGLAILLAVVFLYSSLIFFHSVVFSQVQWW